jgi:hypothetical protein
LAAQRMAQEQHGQTLQPTALVHDGHCVKGQRIGARLTLPARRNDSCVAPRGGACPRRLPRRTWGSTNLSPVGQIGSCLLCPSSMLSARRPEQRAK